MKSGRQESDKQIAFASLQAQTLLHDHEVKQSTETENHGKIEHPQDAVTQIGIDPSQSRTWPAFCPLNRSRHWHAPFIAAVVA